MTDLLIMKVELEKDEKPYHCGAVYSSAWLMSWNGLLCTLIVRRQYNGR